MVQSFGRRHLFCSLYAFEAKRNADFDENPDVLVSLPGNVCECIDVGCGMSEENGHLSTHQLLMLVDCEREQCCQYEGVPVLNGIDFIENY